MATPNIRVSDKERDAAVTALGVHMTSGRLDLSEFEERCERAAVAQTRGELETLFADLPSPHPDLSGAALPGQLVKQGGAGRKVERIGTPGSKALEAVAGIMFVIGVPTAILLTIFLGQWWVFIPVGIIFFIAAGASDAMKSQRSTEQ